MKAVIAVKKEGKFYVATDLVTNVADQGSTEDEAIANLKSIIKKPSFGVRIILSMVRTGFLKDSILAKLLKLCSPVK